MGWDQLTDSQAERELAGQVTKTRRGPGPVHGNPDSQQDHADARTSDPTEFQSQEKQKTPALRAPAEPSSLDESQGDKKAVLVDKW